MLFEDTKIKDKKISSIKIQDVNLMEKTVAIMEEIMVPMEEK